jgi:ornithine decarboxylase
MRSYISPAAAIASLRPENPLVLYRPHALKRAASLFLSQFQGRVLYAVKTNPEEHVLRDLWNAGVRHFDVASLHEVSLVRGLFPTAQLYFMHPVKSPHAISEAYFTYGVRHFSLDTAEELEKILEATHHARDLSLFVRLAMPNHSAEIKLTEKFGVSIDAAPALLRQTRAVASELAVCFHVGSQCMDPDAYRLAAMTVRSVLAKAEVRIDVLDMGGGFPSVYPGMVPPPLGAYFDAIHEAAAPIIEEHRCLLVAEPGRALVAESGSTVVRVELRKGNALYINDGTYGSLFDAGTPRFIFPTKLLREDASATLVPFKFYGPTCDSMDVMEGPFFLPEDVQTGDYIEIGQLGAYGRTMATRFNGFSVGKQVIAVKDAPIMSMLPLPVALPRRKAA